MSAALWHMKYSQAQNNRTVMPDSKAKQVDHMDETKAGREAERSQRFGGFRFVFHRRAGCAK